MLWDKLLLFSMLMVLMVLVLAELLLLPLPSGAVVAAEAGEDATLLLS